MSVNIMEVLLSEKVCQSLRVYFKIRLSDMKIREKYFTIDFVIR